MAARLMLIVSFIVAVASPQVAARDLDALAQIVVPAYTAMNFAMLCREDDPWFLLDTKGPRGTALHYAQHVKDEVIVALRQDEAVDVLKRAADAARATARQELRNVLPNYPHGQVGEITTWCRSAAATFVRSFIEHHDSAHDALLQEIERAKQ